MGKDYYKILGVNKDATPEEIKKAFRKLAHQHHPDKTGGDEKKFKEINEAYQVLGNEDKRRKYDQFGADFAQQGGFGGGMNWDDFMRSARAGGFGAGGQGGNGNFADLNEIFGDMFSGFGFGGGAQRKSAKASGQDVQVNLELSFSEAAFGVEKKIALDLYVTCAHCHGNLAEPGTKIITCKQCHGRGQTEQVQQTFLGSMRVALTCPECGGEGKRAETACTKCRGAGVERARREINVRIPGGINNGETVRLRNEGQAGLRGGPAGDLYVVLNVKPHPKFARDGADVTSREAIPFTTAALGGETAIETLDGSTTVKIPAGTKSGKLFRLKDKGATVLHSRDRGDHYVEVLVAVPEKLTRGQKKLLEELRKEGL